LQPNTRISPDRRPTALVARRRSALENSVGAFEDALRVQAGVVGNIDGAARR
jgi:conjugal transfer/entry exclusion protein